MQKRTMSAVGETKRKELDKLIMLGEMKDREIANELSIDCGLVISRRRTLRNRKNFDQKCERLRRKIAAEMVQQPVEEKKELINVENQIPEPETEPVPRQRKARIRMTDELKEAIAKAYKETKSLSDVAKLFNCSESSVIRVATQFGLYAPLRITLTDDLKMKIAETYEATKSFSETAKEIKCSETTVRRVAEEFGLYTPKHYLPYQKQVVETELISSISTTAETIIKDSAEFKELDLGKHVVCSMFADRHDVPKDCKESIFDTNGLESNQVLDFAWIDSKIQAFILNHINFDADGKPDKDLVVYVSGLQSTLGSICKFCAAMNIKLTLMHYDPAYGKYFPQVVIEGSTNTATYNSKLGKLLEFDHVLLHKDMDVEFLGSTSFYATVKTIYKDVDQHKQESWCYICPEEVSGFDSFRDLTIDIRKHPEAYGSVYLYQVNNRSNGLYFSGSIAKSYNFKKG